MTAAQRYQRLLSDRQVYVLTGLLFFSALPHFFNFPFAISLFFSSVILFRIVFVSVLKRKLSRWLLAVFLLFAFVSVLLPGSKLGTGFGVSLLMVMLAMKTLELKNYRDAYVLLFLCFFLLITLFLYNQEIWLWFYVFLLVIFKLAFLHSLNFSRYPGNAKSTFGNVGKTTLLALPLMLIFFIVFPRLSAPLWAFKQSANTAITGIGNSLSPGTVSELSKSNAVAFRVKFPDNSSLPEPADRYWRGPVMTDTNGYEWYANSKSPAIDWSGESGEGEFDYQLTLEPSGQKWIFALEHAVGRLPEKSHINREFSIINHQIIASRSSFALSSSRQAPFVIDDFSAVDKARFVPDVVTGRLERFVQSLRLQNPDVESYIQSVLDHFNRENFIYTLSPPLLIDNPVDEFLFDSRKGFCEHYATTFVILMRMADIPARVVAGYQGGEWNPAGEHLIVRQSDAHAWAEVWLENRGWLRIDPTAAIAPERVERGIDPDSAETGSPVVFRVQADNPLLQFFQQASWMMDAIDLNWHRWVVRFSDKTQERLFSFTNMGRYSHYLVIGLAVLITMLLIVLMIFFSKRLAYKTVDPARKLWLRFYAKLAKRGVSINKTDGPLTVQNKARHSLPEQAELIDNLVGVYIRLRYSHQDSPHLLNRLKQLVNQF